MSVAEAPLGRRDARRSRIDLDRLTKGARERLERNLDNVVQILALVQDDVQVRLSSARKRLKKHLAKLHVPLAELGFRQRHSPDEEWAARQIERCGHERF